MKLLSVIVPIYNKEKYMDQCIKSIIAQTYAKLEIILIDDGSTDNSAYICDYFQTVDTRIRVIHKMNKGAMDSRKLGVQIASGELITFVDADDWIESNMYEEMMKYYELNEPDIITSGLIYDSNSNISYERDLIEEGIYTKLEIENKIIPRMMYDSVYGRRGVTPSLCNKIMKKTLLESVMEDVSNEVKFGSDACITYPLIAEAEKIIILHKCWYHYICVDNSLCHAFSMESFEATRCFKEEMDRKLNAISDCYNIKFQIERYVWKFLEQIIYQMYSLNIKKNYLFPFEAIPQGSSIILYGAGAVGKSYWDYIEKSQYVIVKSWVDIGYENNKCIYGVEIKSPDIIYTEVYDYIVIAIFDEGLANSIKQDMLKKGVKEEKIIWTLPKIII